MKKDLTGKKFGRLMVAKLSDNQKPHANRKWDCVCECGNTVTSAGSNLVTGHTKSCGCLNSEIARDKKLTHGKTNTKIHSVWNQMKQRCSNPNAEKFMQYGGRGIKVCDEWKEFEPFYNWAMVNGYKEGLSIDRKDVDGNYEPNNCRWVSMKVQANNKTNNKLIEYEGKIYTLQQIIDKSGLTESAVRGRLKRNWNIGDILQRSVLCESKTISN